MLHPNAFDLKIEYLNCLKARVNVCDISFISQLLPLPIVKALKGWITECCTLQGFESRGTEISARLTTWDNLLDSISHVGPLTTNPIQPVTQANTNKRRNKKKKKKKKKSRRERSVGGEEEGQLGRWRRALTEAAPLLTSEHRAAWLCGDPSNVITTSFPSPTPPVRSHHNNLILTETYKGGEEQTERFFLGKKICKRELSRLIPVGIKIATLHHNTLKLKTNIWNIHLVIQWYPKTIGKLLVDF